MATINDFYTIFAEWVYVNKHYGNTDHLPLTVLLENADARQGPVIINAINIDNDQEIIDLTTLNSKIIISSAEPWRIKYGKTKNNKTIFLHAME